MIKINNVDKELSKKLVLNDINLNLEEGKIYLIKGHNGCGKTMLLRLICGLIKATRGQVSYEKDYSFGVIIENPTFFNGETGISNLKYLASIKNKIDIKTIDKYISIFNLNDVKNKKVKTYSLGMKQRLALCQAFMENPDVLLLDEPFNAIDEDNLTIIYDLINSLKKENKIIVIATHGDSSKEKINYDQIINMSSGKIISAELF